MKVVLHHKSGEVEFRDVDRDSDTLLFTERNGAEGALMLAGSKRAQVVHTRTYRRESRSRDVQGVPPNYYEV